ncbi:hypothetical protein H8E07_16000 [bacterium]|nr:hypothetical protein [bacterium]
MDTRIMTLAALAMAGAASLCAAGEEVPVVHNAAPAEADTSVYELTEVWRAGGLDDEVLFGWVMDVIGDEAGRVYLLDSQLKQIVVYDVDGTYLDTLGREGEGPGEFSQPGGMFWWDEDVIAVTAGRIGVLDLIDTGGVPAGSVVLADEGDERIMIGYNTCAALGEALVLSGNMGTGSATGVRTEIVIDAFGRDGRRIARLREHVHERPLHPFVFDEGAGTAPWSGWAAAPDGRFYTAPDRSRYEIEALDADGRTRLRFSRDYDSLERSEVTREEIRSGILDNVRAAFPDAKAVLLDHHRDVRDIQVGHDGHLWITGSRGATTERDEVVCVYDVFDTDGRWLRCAEVRDPHGGALHSLRFLPRERVLCRVMMDEDGGVYHTGDEEAPEETAYGVVCYRLSRRD